jgi:hypothetical protein
MFDEAAIRKAILATLGHGGTYDVRQLRREAPLLSGVPMETVLESVRKLVSEQRVQAVRPWKSSSLDDDAAAILTMYSLR